MAIDPRIPLGGVQPFQPIDPVQIISRWMELGALRDEQQARTLELEIRRADADRQGRVTQILSRSNGDLTPDTIQAITREDPKLGYQLQSLRTKKITDDLALVQQRNGLIGQFASTATNQAEWDTAWGEMTQQGIQLPEAYRTFSPGLMQSLKRRSLSVADQLQLAQDEARLEEQRAARIADDQRQGQQMMETLALQTRGARRDEAALAEQRRHNLATEGIARTNAQTQQRRYTASGTDESMGGPYRTALERAILNVPAVRRPGIVNLANRLWESGDTEQLKQVIQQAAIETENVDTKNQVLGRQATMASLKDTRAILQELKAAGVPTGWMTGTVEDLARRLGKTTNPKYVELSNRLMGTLINYRRAATGVSFSARESGDYARMFPNYRNDLPVNLALIDGLEREMRTYDRTYWEHKLGRDGAALIGALPSDDAASPVKIKSVTEIK